LRIKKSEPRYPGGYQQKLYPFLYQGGGNRRKWLIEHPKLYRFFTFFIFSGGKGNDNGSRQLAVGSWQRKSEIKGQKSEVGKN